jgi:hypothetical protein
MKALKETMSLYMLTNIYYSNLQLPLRYGIMLWGGDNDSTKFL